MEFQEPAGPNNVKGGKTTRPWTRSITQIFRTFRDSYVKGCVTASHNANVSRAAVGAVGFRAVEADDQVLSRSSSRHVEDVISQDFLDLSAKFLRQGSSTDQKGFIQQSSSIYNTPPGQLQGTVATLINPAVTPKLITAISLTTLPSFPSLHIVDIVGLILAVGVFWPLWEIKSRAQLPSSFTRFVLPCSCHFSFETASWGR